MVQSGACKKECLRILFWLIPCALLFTAAPPHCTNSQSSAHFVLGLSSPRPARTSFPSTDRTSSLLMSTLTSS
jgi:hypothetical protein